MFDFAERSGRTFERARAKVRNNCRAMHANHAAQGRANGSDVCLGAAKVFGEDYGEALAALCGEAGKIIEHRGKVWWDAMADIRTALELELSEGPALLKGAIIGSRKVDRMAETIDRAFVPVADALRYQLESFADGWTAPKAKKWTERHPAAYAVAMLIGGGVLGQILAAAAKAWAG